MNPFARLRDALARPGGRILPVLLPVTLAGLNVFAAAVVALQARPLGAEGSAASPSSPIGAALAEAFQSMELEGMAAGGVSLAAVFIVGAAVLYGWAPAVVIAFVGLVLVQMTQRGHSTDRLQRLRLRAQRGGGGVAVAALRR